MKQWICKTPCGLIAIQTAPTRAAAFDAAIARYGWITSMRPARRSQKEARP